VNTIHIIMDTLKRDHLGCYGSTWCRTPHLDAFAARSVVFDQAYASSFPCMPARRDFLTGRCEFPFRGWGPLEENDVPYSRLLSARGITTALVTDHYHLFREGSGNYHWDFDCWHFIRGIEGDRVYTDPVTGLDIDYRCAPERIQQKHRDYYCKFKHFEMKEKGDYHAARTFTDAADWVTRNRGHQKGFALQIDCFPPHEPFDPPPGYAEAYDPDWRGDRLITPDYAPIAGHYTDREVQSIRALYAGNVTFVDECFGTFIKKLDDLGIMPDTMVIVSTDHGTYTGDHGWMGKLGTYLYDCVTHIPLMISCPGIPARREQALVQNVDVAPTMLDAADTAFPHPVHGHSLLPLLRGEVTGVRTAAHSGFFGRQHAVNDGRYALHLSHDQSQPLYWHGTTPSQFVGAGPLGPVELFQGEPRRMVTPNVRSDDPPALFDLVADPGQLHNIFRDEPAVAQRMKNEITAFAQAIQAPETYCARLGVR